MSKLSKMQCFTLDKCSKCLKKNNKTIKQPINTSNLKNSIAYIGAKLWDNLDNDIRSMPHLTLIKLRSTKKIYAIGTIFTVFDRISSF